MRSLPECVALPAWAVFTPNAAWAFLNWGEDVMIEHWMVFILGPNLSAVVVGVCVLATLVWFVTKLVRLTDRCN